MKLLDLFCGRWGWSRAFAARGWECIGVDLHPQRETMPNRCNFWHCDVLNVLPRWLDSFDFIVASSPCEQFSVHGMKNFHPNPAFPEVGVKLFNHTRQLCESSGLPYVMENVRAAQRFVGDAVGHAGSFYLWGSGVPAILPKGLKKGFTRAGGRYRAHEKRSITPAEAATIPPELANCVADYAERICQEVQAPSGRE